MWKVSYINNIYKNFRMVRMDAFSPVPAEIFLQIIQILK